MQRTLLNELDQSVKLSIKKIDIEIKWIGKEQGNAIIRFITNIGFQCLLHLSQDLHGSVFELTHQQQHISLIVDAIKTDQGEVSEIELIVD